MLNISCLSSLTIPTLSSLPVPTFVDICILTLVSFFAFKGFYKGLLYEIMQLACIALTLLTSITILKYNPEAFIKNPIHINILILGMLCLILMPIFWSILKMIHVSTHSSMIFNFNKLLGSVLSIGQIVVILLFIEASVAKYSPEYNLLQNSVIIQYSKHYQKPLTKVLDRINDNYTLALNKKLLNKIIPIQ